MGEEAFVFKFSEIQTEAGAKHAVRAALAGQLVIATIHSKDNLNTINKMLDFGISADDLNQSVVALASQRLIDTGSEKKALMEIAIGSSLTKTMEQVVAGTVNHIPYQTLDEEFLKWMSPEIKEREKERKFDALTKLMQNDVKNYPSLFEMKHEGYKTMVLSFNSPNQDWENGMIIVSKKEKYLTYSSKKLLGLVDMQDDVNQFTKALETFRNYYANGLEAARHNNLENEKKMDAVAISQLSSKKLSKQKSQTMGR